MSGMLRFEILGPQRAWYADRPVDLGPGKQRAVLAVLLLSAGRPVPTNQIIEAVWPEEPPANGPNVVQKYVAGLRRVLEPDRSPRTPGRVLALTDAGYLLRISPEAVDAVRFERGVHRARQRHADGRTAEAQAELAAALELWQGEPFTGFAGAYFDTARHRLVELRAVALESRAELELESGRHRELVGGLVELVAEFPVRERLRHQLMLALYRSGRQAEALAAYREFADLLREEYGIEPGEILQELHRRILRSDPTLQPAEVAASPVAPAPADAPRAADLEPPALAGMPPAAELSAPAGSPVSRPVPPVARPAKPLFKALDIPVGVPASPPLAVPQDAGPLPQNDGPLPPMSAHSGMDPAPALTGYPPPPPAAAEVRRVDPMPRWLSIPVTVVAVLVVLGSFGFLTWLVVLAHAAWRRSWRLLLVAGGYLALVGALAFVFETSPEPEDENSVPVFLVSCGLIFGCWLGGAVHVLLLNTRVRRAVTGIARRRERNEEARRLRREEARQLLYHYPAARRELRIGRPDLPRAYDDGGLIDINVVPEQVISGIPGLSQEQARRVVTDRWLRGPFGSVEELSVRCLLPPSSAEVLRDLLVFLPPTSE
ncbi:DNA-binding transcriptional activator of the SARP family [Micromonospora viridifaciens]|uniref:DNA-binding transcriptional activator of the SARP family n=1 Tax=Micromonospora viridifaciens TaxID=1881 RepID=A0A1C4UZH9_MICVI|nr:BTAD domain-containing putative transcriptional regulator [Micromonospora viridifaciens]SCE77019.1 DNA-binding transcriptional activator of the SARP family [Micromonospora viridifaciens]